MTSDRDHGQLGFVTAQEVGIREGEAQGYFVVGFAGPKGGSRRYHWLTRQAAQKLVGELTNALIDAPLTDAEKTAAIAACKQS